MTARIKLTIKSKKFLKNLDRLKTTYPQAAERIATEFAGESVKEAVQGIIPVRTGNLRSTARVVKGAKGAGAVGVAQARSAKFVTGGIQGKGSPSLFVNYAKWVNDGTSRQSPQFFMERSVNAAARAFNSFSKRVLDGWLKNIR